MFILQISTNVKTKRGMYAITENASIPLDPINVSVKQVSSASLDRNSYLFLCHQFVQKTPPSDIFYNFSNIIESNFAKIEFTYFCYLQYQFTNLNWQFFKVFPRVQYFKNFKCIGRRKYFPYGPISCNKTQYTRCRNDASKYT